jgi:chemotaxis methyl-accepting protein methylase
MLLTDESGRGRPVRPVTVFATDLDETAIATGRAGYYLEGVAVDVPPSRLRNSFTSEPGGYRVSKALRDSVIFAVHNVLRDPPFSRLDLVSCRNLLIYLDRAAQQQVLEMFHFSLRPGGCLFLGTSETVDVAARFFTPVDPCAGCIAPIRWAGHCVRCPRLRPWDPGGCRRASGMRRAAFGCGAAPTPAEVHRQLLGRSRRRACW